jgi:Domain of unknown function (DUF4170)
MQPRPIRACTGRLVPAGSGTPTQSKLEDARAMSNPKTPAKQLLHLVFGGELTSLEGVEFRDLKALDIVGIYPNYAQAYAAWKAAAQRTVDNAMMRYFIVHMHRLLDPEHDPQTADAKGQP